MLPRLMLHVLATALHCSRAKSRHLPLCEGETDPPLVCLRAAV